MTSTEIAALLETFRKKYTPDAAAIDPDVVRLWNEQFRDVHRELMRPAVKEYLATVAPSEGFPKPARLRWYLKKHADAAAGRTGASPAKPAPTPAPTGPCPHCDHGWTESRTVEKAVSSEGEFTYPAGVHPCAHCQPAAHDRWRTTWIPEARRLRPIRRDDLLDFNPAEKVRDAKALLADLGSLTKDLEGAL